MGRTIATFHQLIEQTRARFAPFRRALRREDQQLFDDLFDRAKYYAASGAMEAAAEPFEAVVLALLLEQQKTLRALETRLQERGQEISPGNLSAINRMREICGNLPSQSERNQGDALPPRGEGGLGKPMKGKEIGREIPKNLPT
jgi:hypothetical protein